MLQGDSWEYALEHSTEVVTAVITLMVTHITQSAPLVQLPAGFKQDEFRWAINTLSNDTIQEVSIEQPRLCVGCTA